MQVAILIIHFHSIIGEEGNEENREEEDMTPAVSDSSESVVTQSQCLGLTRTIAEIKSALL